MISVPGKRLADHPLASHEARAARKPFATGLAARSAPILNRDAIEMDSRFPWWWRVAPRLKRRTHSAQPTLWAARRTGRPASVSTSDALQLPDVPVKRHAQRADTQGRGLALRQGGRSALTDAVWSLRDTNDPSPSFQGHQKVCRAGHR
jgi:hypothetical protein